VYTALRYSWWWTVDLSETCRVLYQINFKNSASCWPLLWEYIMMHGPVKVKKADCLVCRIHPSILHTRETAIQNNKYQMSHKYSCSSWWWNRRGPKHVEVINKIDEIYWEYCAPNWFHLQGYMEMDGQQNTNTPVPHQLRTAILTADTQCNVPLLPIYILFHVAMVTIVSVFWFVWRPKKQLCTGELCTEAEERLEHQAYNTL